MNAPANDRWHPLNAVCDELIRLQMERMGWLPDSARKVRHWREEDRRNGIIWSE